MDFPGGSHGKVSAYNAGDPGSIPVVGKISWRRRWQPTPVFLPGKSHGQRNLVGYGVAKSRIQLGDFTHSRLCTINRKLKPRWQPICLQQFTEIFSPLLRSTVHNKRFLSNSVLLIDNAPGHPGALMEIHKVIYVVFMPTDTTSVLQPMDQEVILTFKFY